MRWSLSFLEGTWRENASGFTHTPTIVNSQMFLCVLPVLLALWVAISRTEDNRHFWRDALTGFLLGSLIASVSYFAHYESLWSHISHLPKKLRSDVESDSVSQSRTQSQSGGEPTAQSETQSLISDGSNAHEILEMDNVK